MLPQTISGPASRRNYPAMGVPLCFSGTTQSTNLPVTNAQTYHYGHGKSCFFGGLTQDPTSYLRIAAPGVKLQDCVAAAPAAVQREIPPPQTLVMNNLHSLLGNTCSVTCFKIPFGIIVIVMKSPRASRTSVVLCTYTEIVPT